MNYALNDALSVLKAVPWCKNLGHAEPATGCLVLHDASQARESFETTEWAGFTLMIRNRNYRDAARGDHERFKQWDSLAQAAWSDVSTITETVRRELSSRLCPSAAALKRVDADVWAMLFELVYADLCRTAIWQTRVLPVFERGNLPCGWRGPAIDERWAGASDAALPEGHILIF